MKHFFSIVFCLLVYNPTSSQNFLSLKGKILQKSDSLPVFNAHIYFDGTAIGTTSNINGEFAFHFKKELKGAIIISSIGFISQQITPVNIDNRPIVIYLEDDSFMLNNIIITAIEPIQILKNVIDNMEANYPQGKVSKEIYYKEVFNVNGKPLRYLEIVADLVGEGFRNKKQNPYKYDLFIKQKRPGFNTDTTFEGGNGIGVLHVLNGPKRYLKKKDFKNYKVELEGYSVYRNHEVFKLLIESKGEKKIITSMYITTSTYALVAIDQWYENDDRSPVLPKNFFRYLKWYETVDFVQLDDGLWYINSINDYRLSLSADGNINEIKRLIRLTNVYDDVRNNEKNRITRDTDLYKYPISYRPKFWKTYNAPLETKDEKTVKIELEKK